MIDFVTHVRPIFLWNIQNICGHKSETMWCVELKKSAWVISTMGTLNTPSFVKIWGGSLQFFVDWAWNDPKVNGDSNFFAITQCCTVGLHQHWSWVGSPGSCFVWVIWVRRTSKIIQWIGSCVTQNEKIQNLDAWNCSVSFLRTTPTYCNCSLLSASTWRATLLISYAYVHYKPYPHIDCCCRSVFNTLGSYQNTQSMCINDCS